MDSAGGLILSDASVSIGKQYLSVGTNPVGKMVDTSAVKDFWVEHSRHTSYATTWPDYIIKCFDEDGTLLSGSSPPYVTGIIKNDDDAYSVTATADYGNSYYIYANYSRAFIHFHADVKKAWVGIASHASGSTFGLSSLQVFCDNEVARPSSWPGYDETTYGASGDPTQELQSNISPLGGVLQIGDRVWDINPTDVTLGWVVLKRITTTANGGEPETETVIAVDDASGISDNDIFGVLLDNNVWHWSDVNGAPAGNDVTISHAVPAGRSIPDNATVISYRCGDMVPPDMSGFYWDINGPKLGVGAVPIGMADFVGSSGMWRFNTAGSELYNNLAATVKIYCSNAAGNLALSAGGRDAGDIFIFSAGGNIGIGTTNMGANATLTMGMKSGTAPTSTLVDGFMQYSADITAGNAAPHFRTENGTVIKLDQAIDATASPTFVDPNATGVYKVDGTQVVGNQAVTQAALKADYTTGDLDSEAEIIAAINATNAGFNTLLAKLKTHGLLASA
jgi:hypothetical protein